MVYTVGNTASQAKGVTTSKQPLAYHTAIGAIPAADFSEEIDYINKALSLFTRVVEQVKDSYGSTSLVTTDEGFLHGLWFMPSKNPESSIGSWQGTIFGNYLANAQPESGSGGANRTAEINANDEANAQTQIYPVKNWDEVQDFFPAFTSYAEETTHSATDGRPLLQGETLALSGGLNDSEHARQAYTLGTLIADQTKGEGSPAIFARYEDALDERLNAGLEQLVNVRENIEGPIPTLIGMSGSDDSYPTDGAFWFKDDNSIILTSASGYGYMHAGFGKHEFRKNTDDESIRAGCLSSDSFFAKSAEEEGPILFEGETTQYGGGGKVPYHVQLRWYKPLSHNFDGKSIDGKFIMQVWLDFEKTPPPTPVFTPSPPIGPPNVPVNSDYDSVQIVKYGKNAKLPGRKNRGGQLEQPGTVTVPNGEFESQPVTGGSHKTEPSPYNSNSGTAEYFQGYPVRVDNQFVVGAQGETLGGFDTQLNLGSPCLACNGAAAGYYCGQEDYDWAETAKQWLQNSENRQELLDFNPNLITAANTEILENAITYFRENYAFTGRLPRVANIQYTANYANISANEGIPNYTYPPGQEFHYGTADGMVMFLPPEVGTYWNSDNLTKSETTIGIWNTIPFGWFSDINNNCNFNNQNSAYFAPEVGLSDEIDIGMYFQDSGGLRLGTFTVNGNIEVTGDTCGFWTRDAVNTAVSPVNAGDDIWLPDDDMIAFGNTAAAPDASFKWNSGISALSLSSPYVSHLQSYTDNNNHYQWQKQVTLNYTGGVRNTALYQDYNVIIVQGGANNVTGATRANRTELRNYNTGVVSNLAASEYVVGNYSVGDITYARGATATIYQINDNSDIAQGYSYESLVLNNAKVGHGITSASHFRAGTANYDTGTIGTIKGLEVNNPVVSAGAVTNFYGVYIDSLTNPANPYAFYSAGEGDFLFNAGGTDAANFAINTDTVTILQSDAVTDILAIGDTGGSDYAQFGSDGTLTLVGDARKTKTAWVGICDGYKNPAQSPTFVKLGTGAAMEFSDAATQEVILNMEIPIDADRDEDMEICLGWCQTDSNFTTDDCLWEIDYTVTAVDDDVEGGATGTFSVAKECSAVSGGLTISSFTIPNANIGAGDACIHMAVRRDPLNALDTIENSVFLFGVRISYVRNSLGTAI